MTEPLVAPEGEPTHAHPGGPAAGLPPLDGHAPDEHLVVGVPPAGSEPTDDPWAGDGPALAVAAPVPAELPVPAPTVPAELPVPAPPVPAELPVPAPPVPAEPSLIPPPAPAEPSPPAELSPPAPPVPAEVEPEPVGERGVDATDEPLAEPSGRLSVVAVLLAGALAVLLVLVALLALSARRHDQTETARREGLRAATAAATVLLAYDYRHLDADFAHGLALTTGSFRRDYASTTSKIVGPPALQYQAVVTAQVAVAGVVAASPHAAVVLLFVNQTTTSTRVTGQKLDLNRVRMTMQEVGGRWLVSKVEAL